MPLPRTRNVAPLWVPAGIGEWLLAVERRNLDLATERERGEVEWNLAVQVVPVPLEKRMLLHVDDDVEVAGRAAARTRFAFTTEAQALSRGDAGRNADAQLLFLLHASGAATRSGMAWRRSSRCRGIGRTFAQR